MYINGDMERKLEAVRDWMEDKEKGMKMGILGAISMPEWEKRGKMEMERGGRRGKQEKVER